MSTDLTLRYILMGEDKSASSTIGKVSGGFSKMASAIGGEFGEMLEKVSQAFEKVDGKQASLGQKIMGAGGIAASVGTAMSLIGSADKQAEDQLKAAVEAAGGNMEEYESKFAGVIKAQEGFGHSAVDTQGALQKLTQATNDPEKAIENMGLVANLAAAKHISLSDAAGLVAKVLNGGGGKALKEYGVIMGALENPTKELESSQGKLAKAQEAAAVALHKHGAKSAEYQTAMEKVKVAQEGVSHAQEAGKRNTDELEKRVSELGKKLDGQAVASTDNFAAKLNIARTTMGDWAAKMGSQFGPALQVAGIGLMALGTIMETGIIQKLWSAIGATAAFIGRLVVQTATTVGAAAAQGAVALATGAWTAAQWLLNAALTANPVGLVIAAIVAFIAIIVLAYNKVGWFHTLVDAAWGGIKTAIGAVVDWFQNTAWPILKKVIDFIVGYFQFMWHTYSSVVGWVLDKGATLLGWFGTLRDGVANVLGHIWDPLKAGFQLAMDGIRWLWNHTLGGMHFHLPGIPGTPFQGIDLTIPQLANGGVVSRPTLALIGEAGPEAVVPLSRAGSLGLGGGTVNVYVQGDTDPMGAARRIAQIMQQGRQSGLVF